MVENSRPTVDIDQKDLYDMASILGLMSRVFHDWDKTLFENGHEVHVPALFVATLLLDKKLGQEMLSAAYATFVDVMKKRKILVGSPKEVSWPEWEMESLSHPELSKVYDLGIILFAWNLASKQDELPPEMFLGPLFSCAGTIVEGIDHGYYLEDEKIAKTYEEQRLALSKNHGDEEEFMKALTRQLEAIDQMIHD